MWFVTTGLASITGTPVRAECPSEGSDDAAKFDVAAEKEDIYALVQLLSSTQRIEASEQMHPWAENPRTVGALVATRLTIISHRFKDEIREAEGIPLLVEFLDSGEQDRVHIAAVALNFLTFDCPLNAEAAYWAGAIPALLYLMDDQVGGLRSMAGTTLRNICAEDEVHRQSFVEFGGLEMLVNQINGNLQMSLHRAELNVEAMLNVHDFLEDESGALIQKNGRICVERGVVPRLQGLLSSKDMDLRCVEGDLLALLYTADSTDTRRVLDESRTIY